MADNFFGFDTSFPPRNVLGGKGLDEELLTDVVEEEYDALNDETFGRAANDDWEEAHEKLSELIIRKDVGKSSVFEDSLLETDESQNEIVSKSISQLGLEDDLDDPAIMTIARSCHRMNHMRYRSSNSPPPPAILETEICGSPKTHSIWSTTPKDSGISSIFQSLSHRSSSPCLDQSALLNTSSDSVFSSPPKAWHAEDLEKDLLSSSNTDHPPVHNSSWPQAPQLNNNNPNVSAKVGMFPDNLGQNQNKIAMDRMLTREEVERQMHSESRLHYPPGVNTVPNPRLPWMGGRMPANLMPPMGPRGNLNSPNQNPMVPMRPPMGPLMRNGCAVPDRFYVNSRINNMMHNQLPVRGPVLQNLPPGFNPSNMNMNHSKLMFLPPRSIAHPFLHKQFQFPMVVHNSYYGNDESRNSYQNSEDEYAGLMTQKEKEWLVRIQMLTLKSENPYVEDYYFTTQVARRCRKKYSENSSKASGDAPDLILPETKHESRTFVPVQFEGSLGKLQAVSVNFPRKVLEISVKRSLEDEEGKVVTNQSLMRYRRLLLDIEKLYAHFLEIEDEERRILAKPEGEGGSHRENISRLTKDIYTGLLNGGSEDNFQNMMTVRKGRSFYFRVFKLFNLDQQLQCLVSLFRCLPVVLKRDQNDLILIHNLKMVLDTIDMLSFQHLVLLGETLENDASADPLKGREKSNFVAAFKSKFGTSVICTMLTKAETLYPNLPQNESDLQSRWTKVILHLVDCLCSMPNSSITKSEVLGSKLLDHFQRFAVDRNKFDLLKEKVPLFTSNTLPDVEMKEV